MSTVLYRWDNLSVKKITYAADVQEQGAEEDIGA